MKKLKLDGIKEMLTKDQMKKVVGGYHQCPNGAVHVQGGGWCLTNSCSIAQDAYNNHTTAECSGTTGPVDAYCCATCHDYISC